MSLIFKRDQSPFPEPVISPFPSAYGPGGTSNAMRLDVVWACVRLLADTVAMLPLQALTMKQGTVVPNMSSPTLAFLRAPAPNLSMADWLRQMMISLLLRGNAYGMASNVGTTKMQIVPLSPDRVTVGTDETGQTTYKVNGNAVDRNLILHMTGYVMPGDVKGMSPIAYASTMLQTQMAIDDFARGYFTDAPHPPMVLTSDKPVNQTQAKEIKDRIQDNVGRREPLVLGLGLNLDTLSVTPEESQFLATLQFGVTRICRIFGVPPEMVGGGVPGANITYANVTQRSLDFLTYTVQHWLSRFEQALFPLLPGMQHVKFDARELVRMTPDMAVSIDAQLLKTGVRTINEVRAERGFNPVPWGDEPYLPSFGPTAAAAAETTPQEVPA